MNHILFFNTWGTTNKTKRAEHTTFSSLHNIIPQKNFFYVPSQPNPRTNKITFLHKLHYPGKDPRTITLSTSTNFHKNALYLLAKKNGSFPIKRNTCNNVINDIYSHEWHNVIFTGRCF